VFFPVQISANEIRRRLCVRHVLLHSLHFAGDAAVENKHRRIKVQKKINFLAPSYKRRRIVSFRLFTCSPDFLMFSLYSVFLLFSVQPGCSLLLYPVYVAYDEHVYWLPGIPISTQSVCLTSRCLSLCECRLIEFRKARSTYTKPNAHVCGDRLLLLNTSIYSTPL